MMFRSSVTLRDLLVLGGTLAITVSAANADVLYDTLGDFNTGSQAYIGGFANPGHQGTFWDVQLAEDFAISDGPGFHITSVSADFTTTALGGFQTPANGLLVEFFQDVGGRPANWQEAPPVASILTQSFTQTSLGDVGIGTEAAQFTVDLSGDDIELGAGTWWVSVQPVDLTEDGTQYAWLRRSGGVNQIGEPIHRRNGGEAHGNGFPGGWGSFDWGTGASTSGRLALAVEGTMIPAPGVLALLGIAGFINRGRRR